MARRAAGRPRRAEWERSQGERGREESRAGVGGGEKKRGEMHRSQRKKGEEGDGGRAAGGQEGRRSERLTGEGKTGHG